MRTGRKPIPKLLWGRALLLTALLSLSCGEERYKYREWQAPNWTPDGKIVFQEEYCIDIFKNTVGGTISTSEDYTVTLYEMDKDGSNLTPIATLLHYPEGKSPPGPISTSASDTLIVACLRDYSAYRMLLVNRKTGQIIRDLGQGAYADFSPDGKRIVYQKSVQPPHMVPTQLLSGQSLWELGCG